MVTRKGETLTVHRIVQEVLLAQIPSERRKEWTERSLRLVNDFSPPDPHDVRTWPVWDQLRPHAALITDKADAAGILPKVTGRLIGQLAVLLFTKSLYAEAEPRMKRAVEILEGTQDSDQAELATALSNLAQLLKAKNRLAEAEPMMRRALEIDETTFGAQHPKVAKDLNNLAALLQATNRLAEAEPMMRRALEIFEQSLGPDHPSTQTVSRNLAALLAEIASKTEPALAPREAAE